MTSATMTEPSRRSKKRSAEIRGLSPTSSQTLDDLRSQQQAQHAALISLIITKNVKIQKEIGRNWRLRDIHKRITETNKVLKTFEDTTWPQPKSKSVPNTPWARRQEEAAAAGAHAMENNVIELGKAFADNDPAATVMKDSESTTVTVATTTVEGRSDLEDGDDLKPMESVDMETEEGGVDNGLSHSSSDEDSIEDMKENGTEDMKENGTDDIKDNGTEDIKDNGSVLIHAVKTLDDGMDVSTVLGQQENMGYADEAMHPAVIDALSSYSLIITNPQRVTAKMAEIALESISLLIINRYVSGRAAKQSGSNEGDDENKTQDFGLINLIDCICLCADSPSYADQTSMAKSLLALMTSPTCGVHEAAMLKAVRAVFHVFLVTKSPPAKDVCKAVLLDMLKSVFTRMEAYDAVLSNESPWDDDTSSMGSSMVSSIGSVGNWEGRQENSNDHRSLFASQFHTDGYLLFRALCKLSAKPLKEDADVGTNSTVASTTKITLFTTSSSDPLASKSKTLALELILSVFDHCGAAFKKGEKFLYAVQNYLCESLLKNCMSNNTGVVHLSLKIFLRLVYKFKAHLKAEIEVFVANIFLPVLESPNSPFEQKRLVLDALRSLCSDPVTLTQIFLNYDCDFDAVNLFRIIVHNLTVLSVRSRTNLNSGSKTQSQVLALSMAGLEVLVVTVRAFLKALNLPGGDDNFDTEDSAFAKIRSNLQLDVGMAAKSDDESFLKSMAGFSHTELDISSRDIEIMESSEVVLSPSHHSTSTTAHTAEKIFDAFDRKQMAQQNLEMGTVKFSLSFKQGLLFFIERGFFHLDAREIALFFHEHNEQLDMTMIGEVLGKEPEASFVKDKGVESEKGGEGFYVRILHHFVDLMEFSGLEFDNAIRLFLSGFRLPGEAQKIDRIMEKFAERYTRKNIDIFPSADTAFILAFSVIMLQTDLHNPSIKPEKKMTIEAFIRQNRGISVDGGDLPENLLTGIFKRIQANPFTLKEDDDARAATTFGNSTDAPTFFGSSEDKRRERFRKERAELMAASEILFKKKAAPENSSSVQSELNESVCPADVVKPMFDVTWGPLLGTLSQVLEMADDEDSIALALNGFVYCVRISAHSGMALARNTFILSLTQFTTLGFIKEMKRKNIECIRTLLSIAIMDGEQLGESWQPVLQCISQLGRLQLYASGAGPEEFGDTKKQPVRDESIGFFRSTPKIEMARETEENNGRAVLEAINEVLIEKVFSSSVNLSPVSIVHFVDCLVAVSETEIMGDSTKTIGGVGRLNTTDVPSGGTKSTPRTFSLKRLVEVADYNMNKRPRIVWGDIWNLMAKHFVKIGSHENSNVSMFAIDALRQLSCKFLEKPELDDFNFQRLFLKPFLSIMESPQSHDGTRELILQCVDNILRNSTQNLKSGWKIFFSILAVSGSDPSEKISTFGMAILQRLLDDHLDELSRSKPYEGDCVDAGTNLDGKDKQNNLFDGKAQNANAEDFIGLCRASLSFVERENQLPIGLSLRALCHASIYTDLIASGRVLPPVSGAQSSDRSAFGYTYAGLVGQEALEMVLWRPILDGLAKGMCSTVRSKSGGVGCVLQRGSVITLRAILLCHGHHFSAKQWAMILDQAILPAMQVAAENDSTPVIGIISESPTVSNLDFLADPLPLPPCPDDEGLKKFALAAESDESAPSRSLGKSELLVEASFADLRHCGDGNLTKAHDLVKKAAGGDKKNIEQPFPDSWVATTGPIALGMLTDLFSEKIVNYGLEGRRLIWPMIISQMQRWTIGDPIGKGQSQVRKISVELMEVKKWKPCEALVRIGCKEIYRLTQTLIDSLPRLNVMEGKAWLNTHCLNLADTISKNLDVESILHTELVRAKRQLDLESNSTKGEIIIDSPEKKNRVSTLYGEGIIVGKRVDSYKDNLHTLVNINVVKLDSGATMYGPTYESDSAHTKTESDASSGLSINTEKDPSEEKTSNAKFLLREFIRPLKLGCIASYCLQRILPIVLEDVAKTAGKREVSILLKALEKSRAFACKASLDKELSVLFREATILEWGDDISTCSPGYLSPGGARYRGSSEMFFLTQEAGANKAMIIFLSLLYRSKDQDGNPAWDTARFSEPLLVERMIDVLQKFIISESAIGEHIDPNVWRMHSESGGKIAVYCTSFAAVVVMILSTILGFNVDQFERQKDKIFPILCALVRVQSEEIRKLVSEVLSEKVGLLIEVKKS